MKLQKLITLIRMDMKNLGTRFGLKILKKFPKIRTKIINQIQMQKKIILKVNYMTKLLMLI